MAIIALKTIREAKIKGRRVLMRVDFNVPLGVVRGKLIVRDDTRIKAVWPTVKYLLDKGATKIILVSHLGRPTRGQKELSINPVRQKFYRLFNHQRQIEILENIRFDSREEKNSVSLAKELASLADLFVNDAFSVLHRRASSSVAITRFLPSYAGFLVEKEAETLSKVFSRPKKPFVVIIGGAKLEEKLLAVRFFAKEADTVLVGGLTALYFQQKKAKVLANVILAVDWRGQNKQDIGLKTVALFSREIIKAKTIFWQGTLGQTEDKRYEKGSKTIARAIADSPAKIKIAGGGDTVGFLEKIRLAKKFTDITTGGGAALFFLMNKELPGLTPLQKD
ncbi:phosphoglycerate kinase [Candidatus Berkelbacteria bacterium]|nr:phosphoglycerate kinase [Candidatus Berkelbacteria bacterium]